MIEKLSMNNKAINGEQVRAARALVRLTRDELANAAQIGTATLHRVEATDGELSQRPSVVAAIRRALEDAGVEFIDANGSGPGVRLKKPST